jgi:hypothetical protein
MSLLRFSNLFYSFRLKRRDEDKLYWDPSKKGLSDVRSFYSVLIPHASTPFSWKSTSRNMVPMRTALFAWSTVLGKILAMHNLRKWHVIVFDWCYICKRGREPVDHLLSIVRLLVLYGLLFLVVLG